MAFPVVTASGVIRGGRLVIHDRKAFDSAVKGLKDGWEVDLEVSRFRATRSLQQNRYYHGVVLRAITEYTGIDSATLHDLLKVKFLSREEAVVNAAGEIVDKVTLGTSTRGLTMDEFTAYIEQIRVWAAEKLELDIPQAHEVEAVGYGYGV